MDCDNTLWGGILDEDGLGNIKYGGDDNGAIYLNFQKRLLSLKKQGFILSISSKNNEKKVKLSDSEEKEYELLKK